MNCKRQFKSAITLLLSWLFLTQVTSIAQVNTGGSSTTSDHNKQIIGYVTQWDAWKSSSAGYPSAGSLTQLNIDYSKYTILNYSFFGVANDGSLHSGDYRNKNIYMDGEVQEPADIFCTDIYSSWDLYILFGQLDIIQYISSDVATRAAEQGFEVTVGGSTWSNPTWGLYDKALPLPLKTDGGAGGLLDLAHANGVKVMASIGGWSMCKHYPEMAADATKRARFIEDCKTLINIGFDGIDIDWEYPGTGGMNFEGSDADYTNYTILLQDIRDAIGSDKLITVAMSAAPSKLDGFEWNKLVNIVDYFNMMTYDFNGGWSNIAGHNAPLYEYDGAEEPEFNWQSTLEKLNEKGVPTSQVNMGCPFYGRGVICDGTADLNAATVKTSVTIQPDGPVSTCADYTNWPLDVYDGTPNYSYIVSKTGLGTSNGWTRYWDDQAKVPYMTNGKYFLSYDDEESIGLKAQYIVDHNLAGSIIWTGYGDLEIGGTATSYGTKLVKYSEVSSDLVNTINEVFATGSNDDGSDEDENTSPTISLTSPTNGSSYTEGESITITATASDSDGSITKVEFFNNGSSIGTDSNSPYSISLANVTAGSYSITAVATDNDNLTTTSSSIAVTVNSSSSDNNDDNSGLRIVGYFPDWAGTASAVDYTQLTHVIYAFVQPTSTGVGTFDAVPNSSKLQEIVTYAHAAGAKVLIAAGGWSDEYNPGFEGIAASATNRENFATNAVALCNQYDLDGLDIDWEYPTGFESEYALMMEALATQLHASGKILTAAVAGSDWGGQGINSSACDAMDFVNVMAYDGGSGADHSPYSFSVSALEYWNGKCSDKTKLVLGVPFYSRPGWYSYADLLSQGADPNADYYNGEYYNGIPTIQQKCELAKSYGGIMIWDLSKDATGSNSLLATIYNSLSDGTDDNNDETEELSATAGSSISVTLGESASFSGSASGGTSPYTYSWSFGDGSTSTSASTSHTYTAAGTYTAALTVTDATGTTATSSISVTVTETDNDDDNTGTGCWTEWTAGAYVGGTQVSYNGVNYQAKWWTNGTPGVDSTWENMGTCDGSSSDDGDTASDCWTTWTAGAYVGGSQVSYNGVNYQAKWWTDGTPGSDDVWENMGTCGEYTAELTVSAGVNYSASINEAITFNGTVSGGTSPYVYYWSFGDGGESEEQNPLYTFTEAGTYTVTFVVNDADNNAVSSDATVVISDKTVTPVSPSGLSATASSSSKITLSWTDNSDNETAFLIQSSTDGSSWNDLETVSSNVTSYTNSGLSSATTYFYRVASVNNAGSSDYSVVANATTLPQGESSSDLPATIMSGYWHTWDAGVPFIELNEVDSHWDVINIAFAEPVTPGSTDGTMKFEVSGLSSDYTITDFKADIQSLQSQGKKVVLSIGGYEGYFSLTSSSAVSTFVSAIKGFIDEYGFDGIDIDLEQYSIEFNSGTDADFANPTSPKVVYLIDALNQIVDSYDSDFILSFAPETFYFQMGYTYYGGLNSYVDTRSGVYIPVIYALRDKTTYVQAQLYNSASMKGLDGNWYDMGTVAGIVEMCEMAIEGFPVNGNSSYVFPGLRPDQVVIGVPCSTSAAGSGQISNENLQTAFNTLVASYPDLRGIMTWSINWDAYQNNNSFVIENREFLDGLQSSTLKSTTNSTISEDAKSLITLYPNPVDDILYIDGIGDDAKIEIYNLAGMKIKECHSSQINISELMTGTYIVRVIDTYYTIEKMIIKK